MGIIALVLGIIAFGIAVTFVLAPLGVVIALIGLILGIVDTVKKAKSGGKKVVSIVGLILCAVLFVILVVESFFMFVIKVADIVDYDTNGVSEELETREIETFNVKFLGYEGNQTGSRVKILLNNISINNGYGEHEIDVYYDDIMKDADELKQKIETSQKYTVTFYKDVDGYINKVYINVI